MINDRLRLVLLSFFMLFVELALIRWTGSNVVYLSYFSNFVLLGSFLGIGVGFLRANARVNLFPWSIVVLAALVTFVRVFPVEIDRSGNELIYFGTLARTGLPTWVTLPVIFLAVATVMAMIGEGVARVFKLFEPLEAYRLDILGAIGGIIAFALLSFLHAPPVAWGAIAAGLYALLRAKEMSFLETQGLVLLVVLLLFESLDPQSSWSPYYKVTSHEVNVAGQPAWNVNVNGIPHQLVASVDQRQQTEPIYFIPYDRIVDEQPEDVLVVGAGNGSDVAISLGRGAERVDAVEIDPRIHQLGRELHPNEPYADPRVSSHIDDGRAFLEREDRLYDLIVFALPDSLTLVAGQSSLRLESYLFTEEAMQAAHDHLKPGGAFTMYNFYREDWLIDRLARTLYDVYGHAPCVDSFGGVGRLAAMTIGRSPDATECETTWNVSASAPEVATDDHPFLYLRDRTIPDFYLLTIGLILLASLLAVRGVAGPLRGMRAYVDLFFMGAAFLLLETKSVVQFALWFGTTWFVNALVFLAILLSVYAAVELARRVRWRRPLLLYALLLAALAIAWVVPAPALLELSLPLRFVAAGALAFTPIFLANLVFAQRFRDVGSSTVAFGANLLGAMVGGILEYSALLIGYRSLLFLVAVLYGLAFLSGRRHLVAAPAT